jgi:predicted CXXCH cytochrome family protein
MKTPHVGKSLHPLSRAPDANQTSDARRAQSVIGCATCHEIHQNGRDPLLLKAPRQDSSLCLSCHTELAGLMGTPHDLRQSAPEVRNVRGETAAQSGPCSSCHLVHPTAKGRKTWAQSWPSQQTFGGGYCTCCHRADGCAKDRIPKFASHPQVAITNRLSPGHPDYMPTFSEQGEPSRTGAISCPTCHDLHATAKTPDTGGTPAPAQAMFLRTAARKGFCIDCHGFESLWRFLYYHRADRNPRPMRDASPPAGDTIRYKPAPDANNR